MALTLLIGGARAGKSQLAVRLASASNMPVVFIATAQAFDDEMAERIARHRADRPTGWMTHEEPLDLVRALDEAGKASAVLLDCLTLWVSNLMLEGLAESEIVKRAEEAAGVAARRAAPTFVVTNEVGSGIHPNTELGRRFRDVLGIVNTIWSAHATEALLVVAGRTISLDRPGD